MSDYYLEDRSRLQGQPKRTIGEYVRSNGILVPRIFDSLEEAKAAGVPILARSEHEQEYDGVSGLLASIPLDMSPEDLAEVTSRVANSIKQYCEYTGTDSEVFKSGISYSYWEKLPGVNRTVVADSAIPKRYHIISDAPRGESESVANYTIFTEGKIEQSYGKELTPELENGLSGLVGTYDSVMFLGNFDANHSPIIEMQTVEGSNYFLQYHRARDFDPSRFVLSREGNVLFVRGATAPEGLHVKTTIFYGAIKDKLWNAQREEEACSTRGNAPRIFHELMLRKRKVNIFPSSARIEFSMEKVTAGHIMKSQLFKPEVSIIMDDAAFFDEGEFLKLYRMARSTGQDQTIDLFVQSDGTNAYVERIR